MPDTADTDLQARVDQLEAKLARLERRLDQEAKETLVAVRTLAERDNSFPSSYAGMKKLIERRGVPLRQADGSIKPEGSRAQSYVSLTELEGGEELSAQSVRRDAGLMDS